MGSSAQVLLFVGLCVGVVQASHNWMETIWADIGNRTLAQVTLPGTHDSGAYNLTAMLEPGDSGDPLLNDLIELAEQLGIPINSLVITPWALAQNVTFFDQLMDGIRYIDFRAGWNGSDWHTFHFEAGTLCSVLIDDIATFLNRTSKEVIVVEVSHTSGGPVTEDAKMQLARLLNDSLGPYMLPFTSQLPTLSDMVQAGHRALVSFDDAGVNAAFPTLWPGSYIVNSYADSDNITVMTAYNDEQVKGFQSFSGPGIFKVSWTLTPGADTIIRGLLEASAPHTLIELADTCNDLLEPWSRNYFAQGLPLANIVIVDHFQVSNVTDVALKSSLMKFPVITFP